MAKLTPVQKLALTPSGWAEALALVDKEALEAFFLQCRERNIEPTPEELVGSYEGFTVVVGPDGVAIKQHNFDF